MLTDDRLVRLAVQLARDFGDAPHVLGAGGNVSCKDRRTLWVKSSGATLADIRPAQFVALDRAKLAGLHDIAAQSPRPGRDRKARELAAAATLPGGSAGPSIETGIHNAFPQTFVVRLHPPAANALACAVEGEARMHELFPGALWLPYAAPGQEIGRLAAAAIRSLADRDAAPSLVFLQNHGIFLAADTPEEIHRLHNRVSATLQAAIRSAGLPGDLPVGPDPDPDSFSRIYDLLLDMIPDGEASCVSARGPFAVAEGAIAPNHVLYARRRPFVGPVERSALAAFRERHGFWPRVLSAPEGVFGIGSTQRAVVLALDFAHDGALVRLWAAAFGGVKYLTEEEAMEVELWRQNGRTRDG